MFFGEGYKKLCHRHIVGVRTETVEELIREMRGVKIEKMGPRTEPCGTQVRGDESEK